jgi:hypothetical protein
VPLLVLVPTDLDLRHGRSRLPLIIRRRPVERTILGTMAAHTSGPSLDTWIQAWAALFTAIASGAAWAATRQVRAAARKNGGFASGLISI